MVTGDQIGQTIKYWKERWHTGVLVGIEKRGPRFVAIIKTPVAGQRRKKVPAEDCQIYQEKK